jgi:hypothetical protein
VEFLRHVEPREAVPVHVDDYRVFRSPLSDFLGRFAGANLPTTLRQVSRGETIAICRPASDVESQ